MGTTPDHRLAAGAVLECVDRVMEDMVGAAWAVVRPPGHHAEVSLEEFDDLGFTLNSTPLPVFWGLFFISFKVVFHYFWFFYNYF